MKTGPGYLPPRERYVPRFDLYYQAMPMLKFEQFKVDYKPLPLPDGLASKRVVRERLARLVDRDIKKTRTF